MDRSIPVSAASSVWGNSADFARAGLAIPKTWYMATANVEPFYRFDTNAMDPLRVGGGVGYVVNDRLQIEFTYQGQFTPPKGGGGLEYNESILNLNFKMGLQKGLLQRILNPTSE